MRGRYYSPRLQRFLSPDPLGFGGGDVNLYRYVGNDPVDFRDPLGLMSGASYDMGSGTWSFDGMTYKPGAGGGPGGGTATSTVGGYSDIGPNAPGGFSYTVSTEIVGAGIADLSGIGGGGLVAVQLGGPNAQFRKPPATPKATPTPHFNVATFLYCAGAVTLFVPGPVVGCGAGVVGCAGGIPAGCSQAALMCSAAGINYSLCGAAASQ